MNLYFNIDYTTVYGEELLLNVLLPDKDGKRQTTPYRMSTIDGKGWWHTLKMPEGTGESVLDYFYSVEAEGHERRHEWLTEMHRLDLTAMKAGEYTLYDHWIDIPEDSYLYSSAFTDCVRHQQTEAPRKSQFVSTVRLTVRAPQLRQGERLGVVGSPKVLGAWDMAKAVPMTEHNYNEWMVDLDSTLLPADTFEFKFIILDSRNADTPMWEEGYNRSLHLPQLRDGEAIVYQLDEAHFPIYQPKLAGTLVPVFSLRSKRSFGVGDFGDLKMMIDFMAETHQRVLQILPVNDTTVTHTWTDSYPYSCISVFALHPQYADLSVLPQLRDEKLRLKFSRERRELNALRQIDYERVNQVKTSYLKALYAQDGSQVLGSAAFKRFFTDNERWLVPYAQYCYLRDSYGTADFSTWKDHRTWDESDRKPLSDPRSQAFLKVAFYYYEQFILDAQLAAAHDYARQKGVILKGDIPIGVNRHGCDVWMEPKYFHLDGQAGAPPDDFSVNGQNWGFPTYNWDEMLKDGCQWWTRRFRHMARFFDAYRIDHVLGFFRIWEIPISSVHGLLGQFSPSLAMTRSEIEAYGLHFNETQFVEPFIADWVIDRVFKEHAEEVKEKYLDHAHDDIWHLKPEYDTQRKVEAAFQGKTTTDDVWIRDGLYALISDVLFVRDRKDPNKFHPRISAQFDFTYEALYDSDKAAFNRLYNDYFYRRNNQFWYGEAMKKLPRLVEATRMLVCAEDLGMVPDCVAWVMQELKILSLEIQSMPKDPKVRFGHLSRNPYRSVCTLFTHDMPTLRQWWDEDQGRTQDYYNSMLHREGPAPHPLPGWLARDIVSRHLTSPSMLCILSIQDWLSIDERLRLPDANAERINIPANPHHYWRYRMHLNIEDLMANKDFVTNVSELVSESGRR